MKILHVLLTRLPIPPKKYGGTERVLWALYKGQKALGHEVKFMTKNKAVHEDALEYNPSLSLEAQVEGWADVIHFHFLFENADGKLKTPYVCTTHNQHITDDTLPKNTIFLTKLHAERSGGKVYVHNGLFWDDYGQPNLNMPANHVHFLANAKYRDKNLADSVEIARSAHKNLHVLGGRRLSLKWKRDGKYQPYCYFGNDLTFHGMVGGEQKHELLRQSQALLFPVINYEAFGLAVIESLYFGCPVIGSGYGSLPELIVADVGVSTNSKSKMIDALKSVDMFNRKRCHEYAREQFSHMVMSKNYIHNYEKVLAGHTLHDSRPVTQTLPVGFTLDN